MSEEKETALDNRIQTLLQEVSDLKRENNRLRVLLEDNGIMPAAKDPVPTAPDQGARILPCTITKERINQFFSRFWGRMDVYSQRIVSRTGKIGYYPQCWNFWKSGCRRRPDAHSDGKKGPACIHCPMQAWKKIDSDTIRDHLMGKITIGVYPVFPDGTCRFLVFDFDNHAEGNIQTDYANTDLKWKQEVDAVREICRLNHVDVLAERSRSGKGAHLWLFFEHPLSARRARAFGDALLKKGAESVSLSSFRYFDRMLPAQDSIQDGGLGNLIALPLQAEPLLQGNSAFIDENWNAYPDQWTALLSVRRIQTEAVDAFIRDVSNHDPFGTREPEQTAQDDREKPRRKPWKDTVVFHALDVRGKIHIALSNLIYVDAINLAPRLQNQIRRMAAFSNPVFYKNQAMNLSNFAHSRFVYLGEDIDGYICLPRGLQEELASKIEQYDIPFEISDERESGRAIHVSFQGALRENQKKAADALLAHDTGILSAATAFGKTVVCCDLIAERKTSTLILLESSALIDQWQTALNRFLCIDENLPTYQTPKGRTKRRACLIGVLQGAKDTTTGIIDIAMVGSVFSKGVCHPKLAEYGMILVDECHHAASETIQRILREAKAKYVYGASATPMREDGLEKINYMLLGPIRFRFSAKERAAEQGIDHLVYPRFTRSVCPRNTELTVNDAYELVRDDPARNQLILEDVRACIASGRCPVVLTRYTEHAEKLFQYLQNDVDYPFLLLGHQSAKEKKQIVEQMKAVPDGESVLLIATGKLIGEGFDYPKLDTLIMAAPVAGRTVVEQYAGRLNRDYAGKKDVIIYDYIDAHIPVFDRMYAKRLRAYKQIGYRIYQPTDSGRETKTGYIFDIENYEKTYWDDLLHAKKEIVICSPGLRSNQIQKHLSMLKPVQERGIRITVITWQMDYDRFGSSEARAVLLDRLRSAGVDLRLLENIEEHFAVIDRNIVWFGSLDFLGKEDAEDHLMRICSPEAAAELLEKVCGEE